MARKAVPKAGLSGGGTGFLGVVSSATTCPVVVVFPEEETAGVYDPRIVRIRAPSDDDERRGSGHTPLQEALSAGPVPPHSGAGTTAASAADSGRVLAPWHLITTQKKTTRVDRADDLVDVDDAGHENFTQVATPTPHCSDRKRRIDWKMGLEWTKRIRRLLGC